MIKLILITFTKMVGLGVGIGVSMKTGIDFSNFDPSIFAPKIPDIQINIPNTTYPEIKPSQIYITQSSNNSFLWGCIILSGVGITAVLIVTNKINSLYSAIVGGVTSLFQKIKSFFTWKLPLEQEDLEQEDPFYGCDSSTLLTGFPIGSFNLLDVSKIISVLKFYQEMELK